VFLAYSIGLLLAGSSAAEAMSGGRAPRDVAQIPTTKNPAEIVKRGADYLEQCMRDWDNATHMTKQEWARTCRRVAQERLKFLLEQAKEEENK
jgi:hypothetical protein